jgi:hypothetical protein
MGGGRFPASATRFGIGGQAMRWGTAPACLAIAPKSRSIGRVQAARIGGLWNFDPAFDQTKIRPSNVMEHP